MIPLAYGVARLELEPYAIAVVGHCLEPLRSPRVASVFASS